MDWTSQDDIEGECAPTQLVPASQACDIAEESALEFNPDQSQDAWGAPESLDAWSAPSPVSPPRTAASPPRAEGWSPVPKAPTPPPKSPPPKAPSPVAVQSPKIAAATEPADDELRRWVAARVSRETDLQTVTVKTITNELKAAFGGIKVKGARKALVKADVNLIGFVGSRAAGQHILSTAGADLKRVVLELGGKDPMIVLKNANIDDAADFAVRNSFRNCGQVCVSTERIYVEDGIADDFEQAVLQRVAELKVGDGAEEGTTIGPMVSAQQKAMVLEQLEIAKRQGATVACGDSPMDGNYVTPTVLTGLDHSDFTLGQLNCLSQWRIDRSRCSDKGFVFRIDFNVVIRITGHLDNTNLTRFVDRRSGAAKIKINRTNCIIITRNWIINIIWI